MEVHNGPLGLTYIDKQEKVGRGAKPNTPRERYDRIKLPNEFGEPTLSETGLSPIT